MFKSLSTSLIVRGILAMIVGIIALAWPSVTVLALVILFAVYAFIAAGLEAARAFSSRKAGPVFGHLLLGLVDLAAGVIALVWPGPTALVLVLIVGSWAVVAGLVEIAAAFGRGEAAGTRALFILGGLVSVAFGVVLCARPGVGAVTLALLFGLFNLIYGIWALDAGHRTAPHRQDPGPGRAERTGRAGQRQAWTGALAQSACGPTAGQLKQAERPHQDGSPQGESRLMGRRPTWRHLGRAALPAPRCSTGRWRSRTRSDGVPRRSAASIVPGARREGSPRRMLRIGLRIRYSQYCYQSIRTDIDPSETER